MKIKEISENNRLYSKAFDLRYTLFFEEFDLPRSVTADELEAVSTHVCISENEELLAYGRLSPIEPDTYRISQIVVPAMHRRRGYATMLLKRLMEIAKLKGANKIRLNSQVTVTELYEKLGFQKLGNVYQVKLTGLQHVKMIYEVHA